MKVKNIIMYIFRIQKYLCCFIEAENDLCIKLPDEILDDDIISTIVLSKGIKYKKVEGRVKFRKYKIRVRKWEDGL